MEEKEIQNYKKAGKIASEVVRYSKQIIKKDVLLKEIAAKIESQIVELGGKPAFPVNLCINDIAAHYTPSYNDETLASGLLKVDIGVSVEGAIADTAYSIDLENEDENKKLIESSNKALENSLNLLKKKASNKEEIKINEIGKEIHKTITSSGFSPIRNLSGHQLSFYKVHAGLTIPNYDNNNTKILPKGAYAIEPFSTKGIGIVYDGKPSEIYKLEEKKAVRDHLAREILKYIESEFFTLPFCSRWLVKKFGSRALIALKFLEQSGSLHRYNELVEKSHSPVSQAEHTFIYTDSKIEITT